MGWGANLSRAKRPRNVPSARSSEESGLIARNPTLKGFLSFPGFSNDEDWYAFVFVVTEFEGELIDSPEGTLQWIDDQEISNLYLWEGDFIFLPWLDQKGFFSAKFVYKENKLVSHAAVFYE